jgi:hypothetical protein
MTLLDFAAPARGTPAQRFERWLEANGRIYDLFREYARQVRAAGHRRFSADAIVHRIRWHMMVETTPTPGDDGYKLNNDFTPYLARKLMLDDESFRGFFELRKIQG